MSGQWLDLRIRAVAIPQSIGLTKCLGTGIELEGLRVGIKVGGGAGGVVYSQTSIESHRDLLIHLLVEIERSVVHGLIRQERLALRMN